MNRALILSTALTAVVLFYVVPLGIMAACINLGWVAA